MAAPGSDIVALRSGLPTVGAFVRTCRPRQWVKNVLVFAAPGAAGVAFHRGVALRTGGAFLLFCALSSGTYFMNDLFDRDADRAHPTKRFRPVAAGVISPAAAAISALVLMASAVAIGGSVLGARFGVALGFYAGINVAYNVGLKREPVIDMAAVASGFVIRAIAGGLAAGVVLSNWFLIVASFGSLFVVAGKRHADYGALAGVGRSDTLAADYTDVFLRFVRTVAAGVAICGYCLWAFDRAAGVHRGRAVWLELTVVPFVLAVLRYALLVEAGEGGAPEDVILGNRVILALGAIWLALFVVGVYGSGGIGLG